MGVKELQQAVDGSKRLFVDTNALVYLLDNHPRYVDLSVAVMKAVENGAVQGVVSMISLAEILTRPAQMGDLRALRDYELYLSNFPNLALVPVDTTIARETARLRGLHKLKMPDAILLATAFVTNVEVIVTNDKDWRGKTGAMKLIVLEDYVEQ